MSIKDLIPFKQLGKKGSLAKQMDQDPFEPLHKEINRIFDDFSRGFFNLPTLNSRFFGLQGWGDFVPKADVTENEHQVRVDVELPGMDENDVHVSLNRHELVIRGEKKTEKSHKDKQWSHVERTYGSFNRVIALPESVDGTKAEAIFRKGLLTVTVPKKDEAKVAVKQIPVRRA